MPSVVTGRFEDLVSIGLAVIIDQDPSLELVARDVPPAELAGRISRHSPDVALLNLTTLSEPADVLRLHRAFPGTRILVLAGQPSSAECNQMLSFGATGCLSKETQARDIVNAIHLASRGMHVLPRSAAAGGGADRVERRGGELTARESQVLELLQHGRTNAEIASRLSIGVETVRTHARSVYRKIGVASRRDLARMAREDAVVVDKERRPVPT